MKGKELQIRDLSKRFGDQVILDQIDLDIPLGSHTTVIGKSGIGKSVLLKCIAGLMEPDMGNASVDGDMETFPKCSYMFQQNALFDSLNVAENVGLPLREKEPLKASEITKRVDAILDKLELLDARTKFPGEISGGMQKRVALARALITSPDVILFDEPTTGLDPQRKFAVFEMIRQYRQRFGFTVLMVSHDVPEVFEISDQVAWLDSGHIKFWGSPANLLANAPEELKPFLNPKLSA